MNNFKNLQRPETDPPYKKWTPDPIRQYKGLRPEEPLNIPELPENRKVTNCCGIVLLTIFLIGWIVYSIYIGINSGPIKLLGGVDACGNQCGFKNEKVVSDSKTDNCTPKDYRNYPLTLYEYSEDERTVKAQCIKKEDCKEPLRKKILDRCYPVIKKGEDGFEKIEDEKSWDDFVEDVSKSLTAIPVMIVVGICLCALFFICLRVNAKYTVWGFLIFAILKLAITAAYFWYMAYSTNFQSSVFIGAAVLATIVVILYIALLWFLRKRIELVIALYEIVMEAIFRYPCVFCLPILTLLFSLGIFVTGVYLAILSVSAHQEQEMPSYRLVYLPFLMFMCYWLIFFALGCETVIIAGSMAAYYFAKDRNQLKNPLGRSFYILLRFHLGSVAVGSLIIAILETIRQIVESMEDSDSTVVQVVGCILSVMLRCLQEIAEYLAKKAYMMVAIHGKGLLQSGKRACVILWYFLMDTIAVDTLSSQAMLSYSSSFAILAALIGYGMLSAMGVKYIAVGLIVGLFLTFSVTHAFILLVTTHVETAFLCVCEDMLLNDGSPVRPYFMTTKLQNVLNSAMGIAHEERIKKEEKRRRRRRSSGSE